MTLNKCEHLPTSRQLSIPARTRPPRARTKSQSPLLPTILSPISPVSTFSTADQTSKISGILNSLEKACDITGKRFDAVLNRIFNSSDEGSVNLRLMGGLSAGAVVGWVVAFAFQATAFPSLLWAGVGYLGFMAISQAVKSHGLRYSLKRSLYPLALTTSVFGLRFWLNNKLGTDGYEEVPMTPLLIYLGNYLRNYRFWSIFENTRFKKVHAHDVNVNYPERVHRMEDVTIKLQRLYVVRWENPDHAQSIQKKIDPLEKELKALAKLIPGFRYPSTWRVALYQTVRIFSAGLTVPLAALFLSGAFDIPISLFFMMFWGGQMILGPTGLGYFKNAEVGEVSEPARYADYPNPEGQLSIKALTEFTLGTKEAVVIYEHLKGNYINDEGKIILEDTNRTLEWDKFHKEDCKVLLDEKKVSLEQLREAFYIIEKSLNIKERYKEPGWVIIRLSNTGLCGEGKVPIFLVLDIINSIASGYRVKVDLNNDPKNLYYWEVAGAVNNANCLTARVHLLQEYIMPAIPALAKLSAEEKLMLCRLFFKENLWDPTLEFDHAINRVYQNDWPNYGWFNLFVKQGMEAGNIYCGLALKSLFLEAAKSEPLPARKAAFCRAAEYMEKASSERTRFSLYNIFDDEYVEICVKEMAEQLKFNKALVQEMSQLIAKHRDKHLINTYYHQDRELMGKYYRSAESKKTLNERAWLFATDYFTSMKREAKIAEIAPLMDLYIFGERKDKKKIVSLITELLPSLSTEDAVNFLSMIQKTDMARTTAYLAERPVMSHEFWSELRDLVMTLLAFEREQEDHNLWAWLLMMNDLKNPRPPQTSGQAKYVQRVVEALEANDPGLKTSPPADRAKAFLDLLAGMSSKTPSDTGFAIGAQLEEHLKMLDLVLKKHDYRAVIYRHPFRRVKFLGRTLKWYGRNILRGILAPKEIKYAQKTWLGKAKAWPRKKWDKLKGKIDSLVPELANTALSQWTREVGLAVAKAVAEYQLFGEDYLALLRKFPKESQLTRDTAEDIIYDQWLAKQSNRDSIKNVAKKAVDGQIDMLLIKMPEFSTVITPARRKLIAHIVWDKAKDNFQRARNMLNSTVTGIMWIMTHEVRALEETAKRLKNHNSDLRQYLDHHYKAPSNTTTFAINDDSFETFDASIEQYSLAEIKGFFKDEIKTLAGQAGQQKAAELLKDLDALTDRAIAGFWQAKGYVCTYWTLYNQLPDVLLGKRDLTFQPLERMKINPLSWTDGKTIEKVEARLYKKNKHLDCPGVRLSLQRIIALRSRMKAIEKHLRVLLSEIHHPDALEDRAMEDYTAWHLAKDIVQRFVDNTDVDVASALVHLQQDKYSIFKTAMMGEMEKAFFNDTKKAPASNVLNKWLDRVLKSSFSLRENSQLGIMEKTKKRG
ncbi:MAG: hypothetical protein ABIB65_02155 [Candidatus Margulisiibacteriota bacterium]